MLKEKEEEVMPWVLLFVHLSSPALMSPDWVGGE